MTVGELLKSDFEAVAVSEPERSVDGVYVGDLLSWVMGRALSGQVWVTIMTNVNVAAVAALADIACVVVAEDADPDSELIAAARQKNINLLKSKLPIYETALKLSRLGI